MASPSVTKRLFVAAMLIGGALLGPASRARGQETDKVRKDLYGDPLPAGAVARCGTIRLRFSDTRNGTNSAFAPDGKLLLGKDYSSLWLWETKTGTLLWKVKYDSASDLLFSPDGKQIATKGKESIDLLDATTGKSVQRIAKDYRFVDLPLAFSPDGKMLAASGQNGELFIWKTGSGERVHCFEAHSTAFFIAAFTPDGATLVTVGLDKLICRWDVATGKPIKRFDAAMPEIHQDYLSPDGRTVAVVPRNRDSISVWDTDKGKQRFQLGSELGAKWQFHAFMPDGRIFATTSLDRKSGEEVASFWDTETGKPIRRSPVPKGASGAQVAPDGRTFLVSGGPVIRLWDIATGKRLFDWPAHEQTVGTLAFTRDGQRLVSGAWDGDIRVWDAATGKHQQAMKSHRWGVTSLALSDDDKTVLAGGYETIRLHELTTGKERWRFDIDRPPEEQQRFQNQVLYLSITPDGRSALSFTYVGNFDGLIHILDLATGKSVLRRSLVYTEFRNGSFSPDCKFMVGIRSKIFGPGENSNDPKNREQGRNTALVLLQEVATGREVFSVRLPDFAGPYLRITPDGRMIVTITWQLSASDGYKVTKTTLRVWELASGKERLAIDLPPEGEGFNIKRSLAISEDCRTLAASRSDGIVELWDLASGKGLLRRKGFASQAEALAFTPDGKRLASGHQDGTILIWDLSPKIDNRPNPQKADAKTVEQWWSALAGDDAKAAHAAIWGLAAAPELTLPILRDRLRPAVAPPAEKLKQLLDDLDSEEFATRNTAYKELADLEELAGPAMRDALKEEISAEKRKRLEKLLDITLIVRTPEKLRQVRALEVLEHIGTPEAKQLLTEISKGAPEARLTREAKAALERLNRRAAKN